MSALVADEGGSGQDRGGPGGRTAGAADGELYRHFG